jgi:hypothetical protein
MIPSIVDAKDVPSFKCIISYPPSPISECFQRAPFRKTCRSAEGKPGKDLVGGPKNVTFGRNHVIAFYASLKSLGYKISHPVPFIAYHSSIHILNAIKYHQPISQPPLTTRPPPQA